MIPKNNFIVCLIFVIAGLILYSNTMSHDFVGDDKIVLSKNKNVQRGISAIPSIFQHSTYFGFVSDEKKADQTYRPATLSTYAFEVTLMQGAKPGGHHFFNVLYYGLLCFLIYYFLSQYAFKDRNNLFSFIIAFLFLLHPIHTEVVSNIKSRDELLCFLTFMLSLILLFRYLNTKDVKALIGSIGVYFICLFTKETAVTFVALFPLCVYFFHEVDKKKLLTTTAPYLACALLFLLIRYLVVKDIHNDSTAPYLNNGTLAFSGIERFGLVFYIMLLYLKLLIFPHPLVWDYSYGHFEVDSTIIALGIVALIIHLAMLVYALMTLKKKPMLSFLFLFYLISISLVSNVAIPIGSTMAERFLFIPSLAFCIGIVYYGSKFLKVNFKVEKPRMSNSFIGGLAIIALLFSIKTFSRSQDWKDDETLMFHDAQHSNSMRSKLAEIEVYINKGEPVKAEPLAVTLMKRFPKEADVWYTSALVSAGTQRTEDAISRYSKALEIDSNHVDALNNLGAIYHRQANASMDQELFQKTLDLYNRILVIDKNYTKVYGNLGMVHHIMGNFPEARKYYEIALKLNPKNNDIRGKYISIRDK
jgi:Tfp pilus assembly protein PilF